MHPNLHAFAEPDGTSVNPLLRPSGRNRSDATRVPGPAPKCRIFAPGGTRATGVSRFRANTKALQERFVSRVAKSYDGAMHLRLWLGCGSLLSVLGVLWACSSDPVAPTSGDTCDTYCTRMVSVCSGEPNNPFPGTDPKATCLRVCGNWAPGDSSNSGGDTRACRSQILSSALEATGANLTASCLNAGPISAACGGNCKTFCGLNIATCTGTTSQYASEDECIAQCKNMIPGFENSIPKSVDGNTIACRAYHTMVASGSDTDRKTHCPHAGNPSSLHCDLPYPLVDAGAD